jgi:uncharacterized OB-fold protein
MKKRNPFKQFTQNWHPKLECWKCMQWYSPGLSKCPKCGEKNDDYKKEGNFNDDFVSKSL